VRQAHRSTLAPPDRIIERPRLLNQLEESDAPVLLFVAPAGYGKTTLARQWARGRLDLWWCTAPTGSTDLAELAASLAAALEPMRPGFQAYVQGLLRALPNPSRQPDEIIRGFITALAGARLGTGVIDDYHHLSPNPSAEAARRSAPRATRLPPADRVA
jgi:LuxR family maltose regulon positive regulatory protein